MATVTWDGSTGFWNDDVHWLPATAGDDVPKPGDTAVIGSGTVILTDNEAAQDKLFENNPVTLGGDLGATLLLRNDAPSGRRFSITLGGDAIIEADGNRGFAGSITANQGSLTLKADLGGNLVLLNGGSLNVNNRSTDFEGNVTIERDGMFLSDIVNNGTISLLSGYTDFATNSWTGTGTVTIGSNAEFQFDGFQLGGSGQTISFAGTGGTLYLDYSTPGNFTGTITNFAPGDLIRFVPGEGNITSAAVDTTAHTLTVDDTQGASYVINNFYGAAGALSVVKTVNGFEYIGYTSAAPQLDYQIDAGARAMHADVAHQMTDPSTGAPVTGAGVKVGIISDSYNVLGGADADVAAGYLPAGGVTVLREGSMGDTDEGRAMAELVYQSAPGANLYFASTGAGVDDFASSVQALQAAGCKVIVDDIGLGGEPFFQLGSAAEKAISTAIAGGVTFVSSAGNSGDAFYQHAFTTSQQTLADGSVVQALTFSNGTPYQSITANGGNFDTISLQWDAPFYGTGGVASDQPCCVTLKAFDPTTNALVATSTQVSVGGHLVAESELDLPYKSSSTTYNLAIYQTAGTPAVSEIKYVIDGSSPDGTGVSGTNASGVGGRINDPDAGVGSGTISGHQLLPGNITVGAIDVTNTAAFGRTPDFNDYFSSTGPGTLLFDENGNRYVQPVTVGAPDVTGPDGIETSFFGTFFGTSAAAPNVAAVAALITQVNPNLTPADIAAILAQSAIPLSNEPASEAGAGLVQADVAVRLAEQMTCFRTGTAILTDTGERPVETLAIGDIVITASGARRTIRWLGHRKVDCATARVPSDTWPVRIRAGAFGAGTPARDLHLSQGHPVLVGADADNEGGHLVPIMCLINGTTIERVQVDEVTYWHIELDAHDIVLAAGLPAESYLDWGDRAFFSEGSDHALHNPDFVVPGQGARCRPVAVGGAVVEAERRRLDAVFASRLGAMCSWPTDEPALPGA